MNTLARPKRTGLDYFPLDVSAGVDDEIELIEAEYGLEGFAIFVKLLQKIYKNGYYIEWTEKEQLQFSKRVNVDINCVNVIIMSFLKWELLDKTIFDEHKVLTSRGIQKRFLLAIDRRTTCEMIKEYLLLDKKDISAYKNLVIVCKTPFNVCNNPQREIERESKVKESKEKEKNSKTSSLVVPANEDFEKVRTYFENQYLTLTSNDVSDIQLCLQYGMSPDLINHAVSLAIQQEKKRASYALGICRKWLTSSIFTLEQLTAKSTRGKPGKSTTEDFAKALEEMKAEYGEDDTG